MRLAGVLLGRRRPADDGADRDERRPVGLGLGPGQRLLQRRHVLAGVDVLGVPAVGLVALEHVLGERDVGVVLDRDVVVVVEQGQVAQLLVTGQAGRLGRDALLQAAVAGDHVDLVVERGLARGRVRVEQAPLAAGGHRHPDRRCRRPGRAGRWWSRRRWCDRAPGGPGSASPRSAATSGRRAPGRSRRGTAGCTGSARSDRWTARTGRGPPSSGRSGRAAAPSGTAGRPAAPGSSRCRGARCRPSAPRRRPAAGPCPPPGSPARSTSSGTSALPRLWSAAVSLTWVSGPLKARPVLGRALQA